MTSHHITSHHITFICDVTTLRFPPAKIHLYYVQLKITSRHITYDIMTYSLVDVTALTLSPVRTTSTSSRFTSPSHHITSPSHHITSPSHHITSHYIARSHQITSLHIISHSYVMSLPYVFHQPKTTSSI
eukprot:g82893.t1